MHIDDNLELAATAPSSAGTARPLPAPLGDPLR